jgi:hypothetical protein
MSSEQDRPATLEDLRKIFYNEPQEHLILDTFTGLGSSCEDIAWDDDERERINKPTLLYCSHCEDYFEDPDVEHEWFCGKCSLCAAFTPLSTLGHRNGLCDDCYSEKQKTKKRKAKRDPKRSYYCRKCLQPKKNHTCTLEEGIESLSPLKKTSL